jgi:hypothetical protein
MTIISPFGGMEEPSPADSRTSARFEGKLSIGIDDVSNTLLVSAEGDNLMSVIAGMIKALDEAAMPVSEIRVVTLRKDTDGSRLREALSKILGNAGGGPTSAAPAPTPQHMPGGHAPPGFAVPGEAAAAPGGR